jgi:hypothetical protein
LQAARVAHGSENRCGSLANFLVQKGHRALGLKVFEIRAIAIFGSILISAYFHRYHLLGFTDTSSALPFATEPTINHLVD